MNTMERSLLFHVSIVYRGGRALQRLLHLRGVVRGLREIQVRAADPKRREDTHVPRAERTSFLL